jgi:ferredoxin
MAYRNTTIYFMSGTGNSYRVSKWIGEIAKKKGSNSDVLSAKIKRGKEIMTPSHQLKSNEIRYKPTASSSSGHQPGDDLIGIVFPAHGFTMPWHILKFVWHLPRTKSAHAFCIATRGSFKFGPVFVPGMSGSGTFFIALLLMLKGYNVRGAMSVNMPSNWYSLHPIQKEKNQRAIIAKTHIRIKNFMDKIFSNGKVWFTLNNLYEITAGILLSWISIAYLFIGRFFLAKLFFANKNCNGCGVCVKNCSFAAIKMWGKRKPVPFWKYSCESCMRCAALCPQNAIEAGQSWGVIVYFIATIPIAFYIFSTLNTYIPGIKNLSGSWPGFILGLLFYYPAIFISYYIFHFLLRIPAINWIFTHTTMTHFSFWGRHREPDTSLTHIDENKP